MYVHECLRVTEMFVEWLHTAADAVHGDSSANLWVICTSLLGLVASASCILHGVGVGDPHT